MQARPSFSRRGLKKMLQFLLARNIWTARLRSSNGPYPTGSSLLPELTLSTFRISCFSTVRRPTSPGSVRQPGRSEEHTSELQSLMRISYAVFCLKKKTKKKTDDTQITATKTTIYEITQTTPQKLHDVYIRLPPTT